MAAGTESHYSFGCLDFISSSLTFSQHPLEPPQNSTHKISVKLMQLTSFPARLGALAVDHQKAQIPPVFTLIPYSRRNRWRVLLPCLHRHEKTLDWPDAVAAPHTTEASSSSQTNHNSFYRRAKKTKKTLSHLCYEVMSEEKPCRPFMTLRQKSRWGWKQREQHTLGELRLAPVFNTILLLFLLLCVGAS